MSVITTADTAIQTAKEHVETALKALGEIVVDKVQGSDEYTPEYKRTLTTAYITLIEMRDNL